MIRILFREKERSEEKEKKETGKGDTSSGIEYFIFCHDYLRGIIEMKKVNHRVASGISFFALLLLPLFLVFFLLGESLVSRLQRFPASLLSHPHRNCFFSRSLNGRLLRYLFLSFSFVTSLSYYFISYSFFWPVIEVYCVVRLSTRQREKKIRNLRGFFRAIEKCRS